VTDKERISLLGFEAGACVFHCTILTKSMQEEAEELAQRRQQADDNDILASAHDEATSYRGNEQSLAAHHYNDLKRSDVVSRRPCHISGSLCNTLDSSMLVAGGSALLANISFTVFKQLDQILAD
jgi:hypothetical protein